MGFFSRLIGSGDDEVGLAGLPGTPAATPERRAPPQLELRVGDRVVVRGVGGTVVERVVCFGRGEAKLALAGTDHWLEETAYWGNDDHLLLWRVRDDVPDAFAEPLVVDGVTLVECGGELDDATWEGPGGASRTGTWFIEHFRDAAEEADVDAPFEPYPVRSAQFGDVDDNPEVQVSELVRLVDVVVERA